VALDYGRIRVSKDLTVHLFGTPGQKRFSFMWKVIAKGMHGYIFLVDSGDPASIDDARYIYKFFNNNWKVPHIVAANKQDVPYALNTHQVRKLLNIPQHVPIVPLISTDKESVKNALLVLIDHMIKWYLAKVQQQRT